MAELSLISVFSELSAGRKGNVSAVVMLDRELNEKRMQEIAADLNQPATTFLFPSELSTLYNIRWFAPDGEIDLCGHGTMAATAFLSQGNPERKFSFRFKKGLVNGESNSSGENLIQLPAIPVEEELEVPAVLKEGFGIPVISYFRTSNKYLVLTDNEQSVIDMQPDFARLRDSDVFGYAVTARGDETDFVSRTLVPHVRQLEDHATGSSHAILFPFWKERLQKEKLTALQHSPRGARFTGSTDANGVLLSGEYYVVGHGDVLL